MVSSVPRGNFHAHFPLQMFSFQLADLGGISQVEEAKFARITRAGFFSPVLIVRSVTNQLCFRPAGLQVSILHKNLGNTYALFYIDPAQIMKIVAHKLKDFSSKFCN